MEIPSMSFQKALVTSLGILTLCGASGCASKTGTSDGTSGLTGTGGGTGTSSCNNIDYASYATASPVSFQKDVMPIFGMSCTTSSCHNNHDKNAKLDLGTRCQYDVATKLCTYPAAIDPNSQQTVPYAPLTQAVMDATHTSLLSPALTVSSPTIQRVVPGDPENSFIIQKVTGKQDGTANVCKSLDPSHRITQDPCGDSMPLGGDLLCAGTNRPRFDILAAWIAQGALEN
jgi:hypothetical protein